MSCCAFYCSYNGEEKCVETYWEHVERTIKAWRSFKSYYSGVIKRVLGTYNFDPIAIVLITHDLGKLLRIYRFRKYRYMYRHEIVGAYVLYKMLVNVDRYLATILSLAVLLHHESCIIGYIGELGERYLTVTTLRSFLERYSKDFIIDNNCDFDELVQRLASFEEISGIRDKIYSIKNLLNNLGSKNGVRDLLSVVKSLIIASSVGSMHSLHELRNKVAAILHPLVVLDSVAAHIGRKGLCKRDEDEATWIVNRVAENSEPVSIDELEQMLGRC
jgi:CRISPR/Cas system-associated endonuclease Cas3-HD